MTILILCPNSQCGELFDVPDEAVGTNLDCPACDTAIKISADGSASEIAGGDQPASTDQPEAQDKPQDQAGESAAFDLSDREGEAPKAASDDLADAQEDLDEIDFALAPEQELQPFHGLSPQGELTGLASNGAPPDGQEPSELSTVVEGGKDEFDLGELGIFETQMEEPQDELPFAEPQNQSARTIKFSEQLDEPLDLDELSEAEAFAAQADEEALFSSTRLALIIPAIGLIGIIGGMVMGMIFFPERLIVAGYVGGIAGWVGTFIMAFLLVLGIEQPKAAQIRCRVCRNMFPEGTEVCGWCGAPLEEQSIHPLAADCLHAMPYARASKGRIFALVTAAVLGYLLIAASSRAVDIVEQNHDIWRWVALGFWVLIGFCVLSFWLEHFGNVVRTTLNRQDTPADLPIAFSPSNIGSGLRGLGLLITCVLPIVTIPLLPLGALVAAGAYGPNGELGPGKILRTVCRHAWDFVILWLILMVWLAVLCLSLAILAAVIHKVGPLIPSVPDHSGTIVIVVSRSIAIGLGAAILGLFGVVFARCIGLFGRYQLIARFGAKKTPQP